MTMVAVSLSVVVACGRIPPAETTAPAPSGSSTRSTPASPSVTTSPPATSAKPVEPRTSPTPQPSPEAVDCRQAKCIALTYDDGPDPTLTPKLLSALNKRDAKATFFVLGQLVHAHPEVVKQIQASGSEIGNHSWDHSSLPQLSDAGVKSQLKRTNAAIESATGDRPQLARPPYGANTKRTDRIHRQQRLSEIFWDVDTLDWRYANTDRLVRYVLANAGRNKIILMHDIHQSTVAAAPAIIKGLQAKGYTLATVSDIYPKLRPGGHYPEFQG
ncbi:MAG: polysaccharide deacetylase family protein, partial [Microlunatus sp.]|nr:polysaccharide deacetylase family protein [Microlunatus sp.]